MVSTSVLISASYRRTLGSCEVPTPITDISYTVTLLSSFILSRVCVAAGQGRAHRRCEGSRGSGRVSRGPEDVRGRVTVAEATPGLVRGIN